MTTTRVGGDRNGQGLAQTLSLGELIEHEPFGLTLRAGGDRGLDRRVAGVHNSDMPHPSRVISANWVLLTLGLDLRKRVSTQRDFIAELDAAGVGALGFGVGVHFDEIPKQLLAEARDRDFPVFEVPYETPFSEIISFVNASLFSRDFRVLQRSLSMQNQLKGALREAAPLEALVQRLARLLEGTVVIYDAFGQVEAASHAISTDSVWASIRKDALRLQRLTVDDVNVIAVPVSAVNRPRRWLVVVGQRRSVPETLVLSVIRAAEYLLEILALSASASVSDGRIVRAELLAAIIEVQPAYAEAEVEARLGRYGIDFREPTRIVVFEPVPPTTVVLDRARQALEEAFECEGAPYLIALRGEQLVALIQAEGGRINAVLDRVGQQGVALVAGGGRCVAGVRQVPLSLRDARVALQQLEFRQGHGLLLEEDFGVTSWLVGSTPQREIAAKVDALLKPLVDQPALYATLVVYLQHQLNVSSAATALHMHPNSLRYRIKRIEDLLGRSLSELSLIVDLYVAVLARQGSNGDLAGLTVAFDAHLDEADRTAA